MNARVMLVTADANDHGQRIDNFLLSRVKNVPKSRIYRAIRSGEVRVNKGRCKQTYRVSVGDIVRIPPFVVHGVAQDAMAVIDQSLLAKDNPLSIIYESHECVVVNKPSGMAVHAGSGVRHGAVNYIQSVFDTRVYLAHRLDKEVSGCLLFAKSRDALLALQSAWHEGVTKIYHAIVFYETLPSISCIDTPLASSPDKLQSALTHFRVLQQFDHCLLLEVSIVTGRKHQIRRHLASIGLPIVGDKRYGHFALNRTFAQGRFSHQLMLHARSIDLRCDDFSLTCAAEYGEWFSGMLAFLQTKD